MRIIVLISSLFVALLGIFHFPSSDRAELAAQMDITQTTELWITQQYHQVADREYTLLLSQTKIPRLEDRPINGVAILSKKHTGKVFVQIGLSRWQSSAPQIPFFTLKLPESSPEDLNS